MSPDDDVVSQSSMPVGHVSDFSDDNSSDSKDTVCFRNTGYDNNFQQHMTKFMYDFLSCMDNAANRVPEHLETEQETFWDYLSGVSSFHWTMCMLLWMHSCSCRDTQRVSAQ